MPHTSWKTVSTLATIVVIAGCTESAPSAPAASDSSPTSIMMAPEGRPSLSLSGASSDNVTQTFSVSPSGGVFFIGNHAVYFPAGAICDPASSSYGAGTWDDDCSVTKSTIKITAKVRTAKLGTWIDFTPALRFVPSSNPSKWVWLYMYNPAVAGASDLSKFGINYSSKIGDKGYDESLLDSSLRTYIDTFGAQSVRRIKHFSGYATSSGRSCDPALETDCYPVEDNGLGH